MRCDYAIHGSMEPLVFCTCGQFSNNLKILLTSLPRRIPQYEECGLKVPRALCPVPFLTVPPLALQHTHLQHAKW